MTVILQNVFMKCRIVSSRKSTINLLFKVQMNLEETFVRMVAEGQQLASKFKIRLKKCLNSTKDASHETLMPFLGPSKSFLPFLRIKL